MADHVQEILSHYTSENPRNQDQHSFQRPKAEAMKFLETIMAIYAGEVQ